LRFYLLHVAQERDFGEPRGRHTNAKGEVEAFDTQRYTVPEIRRVCAVAFELARKRKNKVLSAEKANVMYTGVLWREEATKLHKESYSDVALSHMYADALAMQLLRAPKDFVVIVTDVNSHGAVALARRAARRCGRRVELHRRFRPSRLATLLVPPAAARPAP